MALTYAYREFIDGLKSVSAGASVGRTSMPDDSALTEIGEVYEGGIELKREASQVTRHFMEGKFDFAGKVQSRPGPLTGSGKLAIYDLDKFAELTGGTVTKTGTTGTIGKAKYVSGGHAAKVLAVRFRSNTTDEAAEPDYVDLNVYRCRVMAAENFVMNDKSIWLADVTFEFESAYEIDGVPVDVSGTA